MAKTHTSTETPELLLAAPITVAPAPGGKTELYDRVLIAGRIRFFYSSHATSKRSPLDTSCTQGDDVPDFVRTHLRQLAFAHRVFVEQMGLADFFTTGILAEQGVRYLDVVLDDIPVLRGSASAKVAQNTPSYLIGTPHDGLSVCLRLHRALPYSSLTPAHELFHVFQYAHLPLRNMWFMEGLARHAQSWCSTAAQKTEPLPRTAQELMTLLQRWHDAEYFWNRMGELCLPKKAGKSRSKNKGVQLKTHNPHLQGQIFVQKLFARCAEQTEAMRKEMPDRDLPADRRWPLAEMRSGSNAQYILRAITQAVQDCDPKKNKELEGFCRLVEQLDAQRQALAQSAPVQAFLRTLQSLGLGRVRQTAEGCLHSDAFDPALGCLSIEEAAFASGSLTDEQLNTFVVVKHMVGHFRLQHQAQVTSLRGLDALQAIEGDLSIENTGVQAMDNALPSLQRVKGMLQIVGNQALNHIDGFHQLQSIDASLEIQLQPRLERIKAFAQLREIKKGALRLQALPALAEVDGFSILQRARDVDVSGCAIRNADFLSALIRGNPEFPGGIKLTHCQLHDLSGLGALRKVAASLYLHNNQLTHVDSLSSLSSVGASLSLGGNRLEHVDGLSSLQTIGGVLSLHNNRLKHLSGLARLTSVKTTLWNHAARTILIYHNPELKDIVGLSGVQTPDDYLILHCDDALQYERRPDAASPFHRNILQIHQGVGMRPFHTCRWTDKAAHDYSNFRKTTHNKKLVYMHDFETHADTLVLSFSGVNGKLGGIFHNRYPLITEGVHTHKIFINDTSHRWYHGGIPGLTKNITETLEYLKEVIRQYPYKKIVCTGASQGGYMALLAGHQIGATDVLVFALQTFLDDANRAHYGDRRWAKELAKIDKSVSPAFLDLEKLYASLGKKAGKVHIHYGSGVALDVAHVKHIDRFLERAHSYPVDTHYISVHLDRDLGVLNGLVREFIVGQPTVEQNAI